MSAFPQQQRLFSLEEEAALVHDSERAGYFSLLVDRHGRKLQNSYRLTDMADILPRVDRQSDSWMSQGEFKQPNRRCVNLARMGLLFADLDTYKTEWGRVRTPDQLAGGVLHFCDEEGLPRPSLMVFSGRGIQAKWLLSDPVPAAALPRWNACQKYLIDRLLPLGADKAAKDASRVLRLVDTVNTKSGLVVYCVDQQTDIDGKPVRYSFDYMAEHLLPFSREEMAERQKAQAEVRTKRKAAWDARVLRGGKTSNLKGYSPRQLSWDRMNDLRMLNELRGGCDEGSRMLMLHWQINFMLLSGAANPATMFAEAAELAKQLHAGWNYRSAELSTIYSKAKQFARGEKVMFAGREYPALYTPRNDTLINLFSITDDEQRKLRTIISKDMARERDRDRHIARRREAGMIERVAYEQAATAKREQAIALKLQGMSVRAIAAIMGVSVGAVAGYIKVS